MFEFSKTIKDFKATLLGLTWLFLGIMLTYNSWGEYHVRSQLIEHGKLAQATTTAWQASEDPKTHELSDFTLNLRYQTEGGDSVTLENVPTTVELGLEVQRGLTNTVKIRYLPKNPSVARLALDMSPKTIELAMGLLLLVSGVVITIAMFRRDNK